MVAGERNWRAGHLTRRRVLGWAGAAGVAGMVGGAVNGAVARQDAATPTAAEETLPPFDPEAPAGEAPTDLPPRIAWANSADAEFFLRVTRGMEMAAQDRGLEFITAIADGDSARNIEQIETFLQRGVAALAIQPIDVNAQQAVAQRAIDQGICLIGNVFAPSTIQSSAPQYQIGYTQGAAAAKHITEELGGEAQVVYFNSDSIEALIPRKIGALDALAEAGEGVEVVVNMEPGPETQEAGFQAMTSIIQAHPDIDVVLGGDTWVLGALSALEAAGKARDDMYLSGIDGDQQALARVREGGPYKVSFAWAMDVLGYAWGQFGADWLEGKSVPQVTALNGFELNSAAAIDDFEAAMADPREHWRSFEPGITYLGNISYATRDDYLRQLYEG